VDLISVSRVVVDRLLAFMKIDAHFAIERGMPSWKKDLFHCKCPLLEVPTFLKSNETARLYTYG